MLSVIYFFKEGQEFEEKEEFDEKARSAEKYIVSYSDIKTLIKTTGMGWMDIFTLAGKPDKNFNAITDINWDSALHYAYSLFIRIEKNKEKFCENKLESFVIYKNFHFTIEKIINTIRYILKQPDANKYYAWVE